jgi:hypothetical protein
MIEKETAEVFVNFLEAKGTIFPNEKEKLRAKNSFIEFAKIHVEAALQKASIKAKQIEDPYAYTGNTGSEYPADYIIDKNSILNAYPEFNIK